MPPPVTRESFDAQIAHLRRRFREPLPGLEQMIDMAPEHRRRRPIEQARAEGCREGSVLLLVYPIDEVAHTVLTVRSPKLRSHAGQISLPGGRIEENETALDAALRETWEELGIMSDDFEILGRLSQMYIPPSNYCLAPFVAATNQRPAFEPDPGEVADLLEIRLDYFVGPTNRRVEMWTILGQKRRIPFFLFEKHKIWGATGMILSEMAAMWES